MSVRAIILSVGDELVLGQTVDTNSAWLSQQLASIGIAVAAHVTIGDDQKAIEQAIDEAAQRAQIIIITGGIGPTEDDLTRQALATVMKAPLELNEDWLHRLKAFFLRGGREMPPMNQIQAMIPRGAEMIENTAGTAAGIRAVIGADRRVFVMPGVPKEMKIMFDRSLRPELERESSGAVILSKTLHTFGLGESSIAEKLGELMRRDRNPSVGTTVSQGIVSLRINARFSDRETAQRELDATEAACGFALGELIYGAEGQTLAAIVGAMLKESKQTIATAESCTGGLLAKYLTDISGSSAYFKYGWVTYANDAKQSELDVPQSLLAQHGAVSEPVVKAMAQGAREKAKADFALAISGIAGPDGGTADKPVGTVCIALNSQHRSKMKTFRFSGDREMIRDRSAKMGLAMLRFELLGKPLPF
jgi:nicotinamide-nucleotide amidase